jgi:hypothetical protein
MQNTRDITELAAKTAADPAAIIQERLRSSLAELRESVTRAGSDASKT